MTFQRQSPLGPMIIVAAAMLLICLPAVLNAQRPPFAGQRPVTDVGVVPLDNRFSGGSANAAPVLPVAALGDAALVNQLNQRPVDQRPFWLINYEAIEAQKNGGRPTAGQQRPAVVASSLPALTNRFAATEDDGRQPQLFQPASTSSFSADRPTQQPIGGAVLVHGTASDAGNYLTSKPAIVYPLPATTTSTTTSSAGPVVSASSSSSSSNTPTVVMLNGRPFLLTPLAGDGVTGTSIGSVGDAITLQHVQELEQLQQQQQNWQHQSEQPLVFFD